MARKNESLTVEDRGVTFRDFASFQIKLALDGFKDLLVFNVSIVAMILDFIAGRGRRPRLFYSVMRWSERFDQWLNLHSSIKRIDALESGEEPAPEGADVAVDPLLEKFDELMKGATDREGRGPKRPIDPL